MVSTSARPSCPDRSALSSSEFRAFLAGQAISYIGTWVDRIAVDLAVLDLTHDARCLGVAIALQNIPVLLLAPVGGWVADRVDRRTMLMGSQWAMLLIAVALGALAMSGSLTYPHLLVGAGCSGLALAVYQPVRQSFVYDIVGADRLPNALGIDTSFFHVGRCLGPAIGGMIVAAAGFGAAFAVNAASFVVVIVVLTRMRTAGQTQRQDRRSSAPFGKSLREILSHNGSRSTLALTVIAGAFAGNFAIVLTSFTQDVFALDAQYFGWFTTLVAMGAFLAGTVVTRWTRRRHGPLLVPLLCSLIGIIEVGISQLPLLGFAGALIFLGGSVTLFNIHSNLSFQHFANDATRSIAMGVYSSGLMAGVVIGAPVVGVLTAALGARTSLGYCGFACIAGSLTVLLQRPYRALIVRRRMYR